MTEHLVMLENRDFVMASGDPHDLLLLAAKPELSCAEQPTDDVIAPGDAVIDEFSLSLVADRDARRKLDEASRPSSNARSGPTPVCRR